MQEFLAEEVNGSSPVS